MGQQYVREDGFQQARREVSTGYWHSNEFQCLPVRRARAYWQNGQEAVGELADSLAATHAADKVVVSMRVRIEKARPYRTTKCREVGQAFGAGNGDETADNGRRTHVRLLAPSEGRRAL